MCEAYKLNSKWVVVGCVWYPNSLLKWYTVLRVDGAACGVRECGSSFRSYDVKNTFFKQVWCDQLNSVNKSKFRIIKILLSLTMIWKGGKMLRWKRSVSFRWWKKKFAISVPQCSVVFRSVQQEIKVRKFGAVPRGCEPSNVILV